jgi:hypothetical protein
MKEYDVVYYKSEPWQTSFLASIRDCVLYPAKYFEMNDESLSHIQSNMKDDPIEFANTYIERNLRKSIQLLTDNIFCDMNVLGCAAYWLSSLKLMCFGKGVSQSVHACIGTLLELIGNVELVYPSEAKYGTIRSWQFDGKAKPIAKQKRMTKTERKWREKIDAWERATGQRL